MARDRRQSPRLESLEGRQLLSAMHYDHIVARAAAPVVLDGKLQGNLSSYTEAAGPPRTMSEAFSGRVRSMGRVNGVVADQVDSSGNLIGGSITLTNRRGAVVLGFGPGSTVSTQQAGTLYSQVVRYSVVSGTGAYAGAGGTGTFASLQVANKSSTLVIESTGG
jgi:hypothetical protein